MNNIDVLLEEVRSTRRQVSASSSEFVYLLLLAGRQLGYNSLFFVMTATLK